MRYGGLWGVAGVALVLAGGSIMDRAGQAQPAALAAWRQAAMDASAAQQRVQVSAADGLITEKERAQVKGEAEDAWARAALAAERAGTAGSVDRWTLNTGFALKMCGAALAVVLMIAEGIGMARAHRAASTPG